MNVQARETMTTSALCDALSIYIEDNQRSSDSNERWLATALVPAMVMAREVRNSRLSLENKKLVSAFRAEEIEKELEGRRREVESLERNLKAIRNDPAVAPQ